MPERLSLATVAICAVLALAGFGGAYTLAHDGPTEPSSASALASPTTIRLQDDPIGTLRRVSPLPALVVPPPRPEPAEPVPAVEDPALVVPAAAPTPAPVFTPPPAPAPAPAPQPQAPAKKPLTFDDSG